MKLLLNEDNNSLNIILDDVKEFCDIFNLEIVSFEYSDTDYDYYVATKACLNSPFGYNYYNPIFYIRISGGKIYMCEENEENYMEIEDYKKYLIKDFENDGWVYENGFWT